MKQHEFFGFQVKVDEEKTRQWYITAGTWGCECSHCQNFLEAVKKELLPESVAGILRQLEIPPEKATYVCRLYPAGNGHCYQFSYRIAGKILSEGEAAGEGRCGQEPYPFGAPGFPEPHFDLDFSVILPWVLE